MDYKCNRKSRASHPGPGFQSSATLPKMPKKHSNGLITQCTNLDIKTNVDEAMAFLKEAAIMSEFEHPNVLSLIGVVLRSRTPLIVLPYMEYGDLRTYISDTTRVSITDTHTHIHTHIHTHTHTHTHTPERPEPDRGGPQEQDSTHRPGVHGIRRPQDLHIRHNKGQY